jgi:VWFA-related protein
VLPGIAALLILILRTTSGQAPPQTAPPTTVFKATTRLVTIDVVVQDHKGQPVQGLTKDDFELLEDGEPQKISVFSVEGNSASPGPGAPPIGAPAATLPLQTVANPPASPPAAPATATVILLDGLNTSVEDLAMARNQVAKFIRQMEPQDRVALYTLGANLRVLQDFTNDPALLLKALEGMNPHRAVAAVESTAMSAEVGGILDRTQSMYDPSQNIHTLQRPIMTLSVFAAISEHLAHVPGRKTLLWISYGIPITVKTFVPNAPPDETDLTPQIRRVSRLLSNYHVAVYPIDARGLVVGIFGGGRRAMENAHGASLLLAGLTGGRAVYSDNDFVLAMRTAIDDSKLTYVLGFYPAAEKWDSQFHTFKVRVNRPGVKLLYRTGYLAVDEQNQPADEQQRMIDSALQSPVDSTAIGFRAQLQKSGGGGTPQLILNLTVDITDLQLKQDYNHWTGGVEIIIAQRGPDGNIVSESTRKHSVALNLKEDLYTQLQKQGLSLSFPVALDPHSSQLKVLVRDANSGAMGSASVPLGKM